MRPSIRPISTSQLNPLPDLHLWPINLVVYEVPLGSLDALRRPRINLDTQSWMGLHAYMLSAFIRSGRSYSAVPLAGQLIHHRSVYHGPLVLKVETRRYRAPTPDRDRPVSRRSKPNSRTALIGEQPNPWNLLQLQDAMSRHRGAKPLRRYGRSGAISLLSPEYLLSVERRPFHMESAGSLGPAFTPAGRIGSRS